jgi:hypothetical protein
VLDPIAPFADAGGPYLFDLGLTTSFALDGTGSVNPDEGFAESGSPGDTIQEYAWDLDNDGLFDDAFGPSPDVTSFYQSAGIGDYLVWLQVIDTTSVSLPSTGFGDLSDTDSAVVQVRQVTSSVPEPATLVLMAIGLAGIGFARRKKAWVKNN